MDKFEECIAASKLRSEDRHIQDQIFNYLREYTGNIGTVYLLSLDDGDIPVVKFGITQLPLKLRILSLIHSFHDVRGYYPKIQVIKQEEVTNPEAFEKILLARTKKWDYFSEDYFVGVGEFRDMNLDLAVEIFEEELENFEQAQKKPS